MQTYRKGQNIVADLKCEKCPTIRTVQVVNGKPVSKLCKKCANKLNHPNIFPRTEPYAYIRKYEQTV